MYKGSATKGQFRKCSLTCFQSMAEKEQGQGGREDAIPSARSAPLARWHVS